VLTKNDSVVATFTAKIYHLTDSYEEHQYYPAMTYETSSSYLTIDVTEKSAPILLIFSIVPRIVAGDELRALFSLKGSDENSSESESGDDSKHDDKSPKNKDKKSRKLAFGLHFKKPSKTATSTLALDASGNASVNSELSVFSPVFTNKNNEYFVVNPKVNMLCHLTKEGLNYRSLVSTPTSTWKVQMNLSDLKLVGLHAKSKNTVEVERGKSKQLEIEEQVKYYDKDDLTGILHSFRIISGPPTPVTITQNVSVKGIVDVIQDQKGITFCVGGGIPVLLYRYMDIFDATGKPIKSTMNLDLKKNVLTIKLHEAGEYPILLQ